MIEKLRTYINENLETEIFVNFKRFKYGKENASCTVFIDEEKALNRIDRTYLDEEFDKELSIDETNCEFGEAILTNSEKKAKNIDDFINNSQTESKFQKLLFELIDERQLKDSDVYNKVHIDRRLFSKIRSDQNYHPSKDTVILLGLALELSEKEFEELLNSASYSLPKNNVYDLIIRFCFIEKIYDLIKVNEFLASYDCKLFSY